MRGITVPDLLTFLGLAAIIGAIAMYGVARYVRHAKTTEAVGSVTTLAAAAARHYDESDSSQPTGADPSRVHAMRTFPATSRVPVPEDPLNVRGKRYQSNQAEWAVSPWKEMRFSIVQPQCYQYAFESDGAGAVAKATVTAQGDLDGDGVRSTYSLGIAPDDALSAKVAPTMLKQDAEE